MSYESVNKIEDNLYLGDFGSAIELSEIQKYDIKRILTILPKPIDQIDRYPGITYKHIWATDNMSQDLLFHFSECNQYISDGQKNCQNVLVHCFAGVSRSATIVIAFLMNKHIMSYSSAYNLVKSKRSQIQPNPGFVDQLKLYEENGHTLNANNRKLRRYLVKQIIAKTYQNNYTIQIGDYFQKLSQAEKATNHLTLGEEFICVECNFKLFNEIHVIKNDNLDSNKTQISNNACKTMYIEPQQWMSKLDFSPDIGDLKCPKCAKTVGGFNFYMRPFICKCPLHDQIKYFNFKIKDKMYKIKSKV